MYTVNKGPSKLVAKTRGGLSQNFEKIETIREISRKCSENCDNEINVPRPVFQQQRKAYHHHKEQKLDSELTSPQHQELVEYIRDSWNIVASANNQTTNTYEQSEPSDDAINSVPAKRIIVYHDAPPSPVLKDFGAFDLESWWGRR